LTKLSQYTVQYICIW